jgi:cobalamin biosynthesis Co2+ chelatase CbiK
MSWRVGGGEHDYLERGVQKAAAKFAVLSMCHPLWYWKESEAANHADLSAPVRRSGVS